MKRRDLIKELEKHGCILIRNGAKHDWYMNPKTKISQPVPRHSEINDYGSSVLSVGILDFKSP